MNITSADPTAPPPQPPQAPASGCARHPTEQFTGFCPSCLFDRLTTLDSSSAAPSTSRRPSSAIKALFSVNSRPTNLPPPPPPPLPKPTSSFLPELRRTKSFSASKNEALGISTEPQRKSCDVRANQTLWSLFSLDGDAKKNPNPNSSNNPFLEEDEIEEEFKDSSANIEDIAASDGDGDEIRPIHDTHFEISLVNNNNNDNHTEIVEEKSASVSVNNFTKPMKDQADLVTAGAHGKKSSGRVFWSAASVFSKKWHDWRHKQKTKKQSHRGKRLPTTLPVENPISRRYRDTQSEVADYGYGRRSVDVDTRFSLDAGRISFDDVRYSLDEPRASYDGYLIGKSFPRMAAPMLAVLEDAPQSARASRADMEMPLDESNFIDGPESLPGGSAQTRNYYLDSSSKRRKSVELDRSNSIRKTAAAVVAEIDERKMGSNAKVLQTSTAADYFQREAVRDAYPNSLKDDISETFDLSSRYRDGNKNLDQGEKKEKSKKWGWKIWGFMHRKNHHKDEDEKSSNLNGVERSLSQSWQESRRDDNRNSLVRSNSSVSWRHGNQAGGPLVGARRSNVDVYSDVYGNGKKKNSEFVLDKNRNNVRYSPNNLDNGLLRFYLTPHRINHRRVGTGKVKPTNSNPITRSVMRMY